ncbi:MAG: MFS transporter [Leptospiraceae bacterium]|nr:MFS transporter [Leptospiraceae bacterium]MCP5495014.1 MFS transporter [Leptospiraceae bacterium]
MKNNKTQKVWRVRILSTTWLSYAGFYFCRKNFSIVKSSIQDSMKISNSDLAHIFTAYLIAYMLGQFLTSYLGRRTTIRILLLTGMGTAILANFVFGFSYLMGPAGYYPFMLFMVINGFAQATGWPCNIGILSNWLQRQERGRVMALWATSYQLGSILAKMFAAFMLGLLGALWSFWGASIILFSVWVLFYILERDKPEDVGLEPLVEEVEIVTSVSPNDQIRTTGIFAGWSTNVIFTIFFMGSVYFVFKFLRYALDSWSPMAIENIFNVEKDYAGYISTLFDWIGFTGVLFAGWATDKFFGGKRHQIILYMTIGMFGAFTVLYLFGMSSLFLFGISLSLCGFMLMGPDSLLAGVGAIDVGGKNGAIVAAGIINGLGSIGPIFQEEIIGYVLDNYGYKSSFLLLIGICILGIIGTAYLSFRSRKGLSNL